MSLGQLMLFVSTLETAKSFYVDLLGLEVAHDMSNNGMLIMKNDGAFLTIHEGYKPNETLLREHCRIVPIFRVSNVVEMKNKLIKKNRTLR